jgi:hypothetical protein
MKSILTTLSFCLLVTPWGIAQNQPPPPPPNILIHVEFVEMSAADTLLLMHGETMPADGQQWRKALEGLFQDGKGKVVGEACVTTRSGQRATAESVDEHIYATEFDPAKGRAEGSPAVPAGLSAVDVPTATSFEMRPAGVRCEVDLAEALGEVVGGRLGDDLGLLEGRFFALLDEKALVVGG